MNIEARQVMFAALTTLSAITALAFFISDISSFMPEILITVWALFSLYYFLAE